jgi:hypothetical protein
MIVSQRIEPFDAAHLARISGIARPFTYSVRIPNIQRPGLRGMGIILPQLPTIPDAGAVPFDDPSGVYGTASSVDPAVYDFPNSGPSIDIPGVGPLDSQTVRDVHGFISDFLSWLGIGAGRREADLITPTQNRLTDSWGPCVNAILVGQRPSCDTLRQCYLRTWQGAVAFIQFVSRRDIFSDGRASTQAMNGIMPYVDGSCGYKWPPPFRPTQFNCLGWGGGTIGGNGTTGILGAIQRAMNVMGCGAPPPVTPVPGGGFTPHPEPVLPGGGPLLGGLSGNTLLIGLGVLALYMYGRRRG